MTAPDDLARTLAEQIIEAAFTAKYQAEVANSERITTCSPNKPGWNSAAWNREHPHVDEQDAMVDAVASVVSRRDTDLRTRIEAVHRDLVNGHYPKIMDPVEMVVGRLARALDGDTREDTPRCICDGAAYHTTEENARRHPFLVNDSCPVHGGR